ncbi:putative major facilitator superfamily transporter [Gordonia araii NBRC 100433]|uniref:Putative major facilitator superfamily transporter n=1 Tax=Gordonia araii NBRC 100433 TaxID=1073574 RepID=G7H1V6_9ACTN|nr:MFS transporter [Gordonia araii]GAB09831.1 putative major facilitator superfamily transporter [Gordonia araii NBRC 100433]
MPRALAPFARRQYRWLVGGLILSIFADGVWAITLVWQVIGLGGRPTQVSVATAAAAIGMVVSTLAGGVLADRVSQRRIVIALEVAKTAVFAAVGIASLTGTLQMWHVVIAALLAGVTTGMYYPAYSAMLPAILAPTQLQAANGVEGFLRPVAYQAVGPMIAGWVIAATAPGYAVLLAAVASILSGLCYLAMAPVPLRRDPNTLSGNPIQGVFKDLAEGFAYLWRTPWLWATLFFSSVLVLATLGPIEVLIPFLLRERVGGDASDHALVLAAFGVGAALTSLFFASIPMPRRYLTVMFAIWGLASLPLVLVGVASATWMVVLAGFLTGILFDGPMVLWGTLLQRRVPPALLGRVASLDFFVSIALMPVSMAIAAPVSEVLGLTATFVLAGLIPVPIAAVFYVAARLWRDEIAHPLVDEPDEAGEAELPSGRTT